MIILPIKHGTLTHSKIRQLRGGILGLVVKGSVGPTMAGVRALLINFVLFLSLDKDSKDYVYSS